MMDRLWFIIVSISISAANSCFFYARCDSHQVRTAFWNAIAICTTFQLMETFPCVHKSVGRKGSFSNLLDCELQKEF